MSNEEKVSILTSTRPYFVEVVDDAIEKRKMTTFPLAKTYLVDLLDHYMITQNLYEDPNEKNSHNRTMAEKFLEAHLLSDNQKTEQLKRLADSALYVSGFFGDSLNRKLIDLDYYVDLGETAYASLADCSGEDLVSKVYEELSSKFTAFMDVLTLISQKALFQTNEDVLRLYDRYLNTGSELAKDRLVELGILHNQVSTKKQ